MRIVELASVEGHIAFDLDCPTSAGGTRLAPDVTPGEAGLLARAMTYKLAVLGERIGGAKAVLRADAEHRADTVARYCAEITPLVKEGVFLTSSDLGTRTQDFAPLPGYRTDSVMHQEVGGELVDTVVTGLGVVAAAETALGGLDGRTIAVEGFGKVGGAVAREAVLRGARVVALSTLHGCVTDPSGLDVAALEELRAEHGDACVSRLGLPVLPAAALYEVAADVLVPGARTGTLSASRTASVRARVVAPAANVPYTADGLRVLRERGVMTLADFVCGAGATIGYVAEQSRRISDAVSARALVEERVTQLTALALEHPDGPYAGSCAVAEDFLATWRDVGGLPDGPPLAPEPTR
ncbi:glutamate dehydrogenase (NAD(P)+)/glutamate dehydrogenase (NADP+) [Nonomuraea maritima]|uniref:Glutamate dehydrogenase (NAD(P)+)/glutamate dehydrogenase (NADP+) n=1 Tax=Nonomuraea maritima TaxID=683260 RepID=A0A1G9DCV4_9ACTN|nr:Glu/Leu/Phe/Val dehydrogenase dimerization domain-containing protein [Nonomuraea maritima]SDK61634.1 glutamate dehydrogenase (NAD(P)+)/glutamate dehydrogenase (NADP+) [Nonomuraea maritima]